MSINSRGEISSGGTEHVDVELTRKVPSNDRLQLHDPRLAHQHRAPLELFRPEQLNLRAHAWRHPIERRRDEVVLDEVREAGEPEDGELREELAFASHALS